MSRITNAHRCKFYELNQLDPASKNKMLSLKYSTDEMKSEKKNSTESLTI